MKIETPLRVGIVGCGRAATERWGHIPALRRTRKVKLAAVCDANEDLARRVATGFHIDRYYSDLSQMLKAEEFDMVDICTPPATHVPLCIAVAEAGCHVLVEKPMAPSAKEAEQMIEAAKRNGVKLCVVHNKLFQPIVVKAGSMVSQGFVGNLTGIDIRDTWAKDSPEVRQFARQDHWYHKLPGGVLGEILPHSIYLAMAFLGNLEPAAVHSRRLGSHAGVAADEMRVILEGEKGIGTITASCNWPRGGTWLDIFGTERNLHVDLKSAVLTRYGAGGEGRPWRTLDNLGQTYQQLAGTLSNAARIMLGRQRFSHHVLIERFVAAIENDAPPPVGGEEGRELVRVLEKIAARV